MLKERGNDFITAANHKKQSAKVAFHVSRAKIALHNGSNTKAKIFKSDQKLCPWTIALIWIFVKH